MQPGSYNMSDFTVPQSNVQQHPASVDAYIRHGWKLVPIPPGSKGPIAAGWNKPENALQSEQHLPKFHGIGLCHAYSGTMALDIDDWSTAQSEMMKYGIDLNQLYQAPDAVIIDSGRQGHGKLLYAMPGGIPMRSKKLIATRPDGSKFNYLDFRCATANGMTMQDCLPPTIHPNTNQPYRWAGNGNWGRLPVIPETLLKVWQSLIEEEQVRNITNADSFDASWEEIREVLSYIHPDVNRDEWVNVGMALHWAGSVTNQLDQAYMIYDEWSQGSQEVTATKYDKRALDSAWRSFTPDGGISIGTLFDLGKKHGWKRKVPSAEELFKDVKLTDESDPVSMLEMFKPPKPAPDLSLFPNVLATRAQEVADSVGCDVLVPLFAGLSTVSGAVNAKTRLELTHGFRVPPILWVMTIGEPADKKSPGSKPMMQILRTIEKEDRKRFSEAMLKWEAMEAKHLDERKEYIDVIKNPLAMTENEVMPEVSDLPPKPVSKKIVISDITSQKLVRNAADRPEGLLCWLDEMNAWVNKLTNKNSGEDRSAWVMGYEGDFYEMDRVSSGPIWCENMAVSIYGNIQPKVLHQAFRSMGTDGLLQRFLPISLRGDMTGLGNPIPEVFSSATVWDNQIRKIHNNLEKVYRLSPEAYSEFRQFQQWYETMKREDRAIQVSDTYMTAFGKLEGLTGRFMLLFQLIENPDVTELDLKIVQNVIQLMKEFVIPSLRFAWGDMGGITDESFNHWIMQHILALAGTQENVTLRELKNSARRRLTDIPNWQKDQLIVDAMYDLEVSKWVYCMTELGGRKDSITWVINPQLKSVYAEQRKKILDIRQARLDESRAIAAKSGRVIEERMVKGYDD